jgi:hypothetical protein
MTESASQEGVDILLSMSGRVVAFRVIFAQIANGSLKAGLLLSQMLFHAQSERTENGWFSRTREEWERETCLTRHEQDAARAELRRLGFIEEKRVGIPAQMSFRIRFVPIIEALRKQSRLPKTGNLERRNSATLLAENQPEIRKEKAILETFSLASPEVAKPVHKGKQKSDPRHAPFKELIFRCYRYLNQDSDPPWGPGDAKQLSALLTETPGLTEQQFKRWLANYANSEDVTRSARPSAFLPRLFNYGSGPRDEWHRVKHQTRAVNDSPGPGAILREQLAEENRRKGLM